MSEDAQHNSIQEEHNLSETPPPRPPIVEVRQLHDYTGPLPCSKLTCTGEIRSRIICARDVYAGDSYTRDVYTGTIFRQCKSPQGRRITESEVREEEW